MAQPDEINFESPEACPNCGTYVGDSSICENCGAVLFNEEEMGEFEEDEDLENKI